MALRSSRKNASQPAIEHRQVAIFDEIPNWGREFSGLLLQPQQPINPAHLQLRIHDQALTVKITSANAPNETAVVSFAAGQVERLPSFAKYPHRMGIPENLDLTKGVAGWCADTLAVRFPLKDIGRPANCPPLFERQDAPIIPIPIDFGPPDTPIIQLPKAKKREPAMPVQYEKILTKDGVRYRPLADAAPLACTKRTTLLDWIKNKTKITGRPLQSYYLAALDAYFVSEESIQRAANRFIKVPSREPAGPVTLGSTGNGSGFIGLPEARAILGVSNRTMYLWATEGTAPTDKPLDVIQDPISEHLFVREKDIHRLKSHIPKGGLRRGRRPLAELQS